MDRYGRVPTAEEFQFLQDRFGFLLEHGVMILAQGVSIYDRPPGKVGQRQWLWVHRNLLGHGYRRKLDFSNRLPKLFGGNLALEKRLGIVTVCEENWEDFILSAANMSASWRAHRKMRYGGRDFFVDGPVCHYQGKLFHRKIDLAEVLPPPVSERCMGELVRLLLVEKGNMGSSGPTSLSQPTYTVVSPVRLPFCVPSGLPAGVQEGRSNTPTRKRRSLRVVPSSNEETESDNAGVHLRKSRRTVSVARLLGGIGIFSVVNFLYLSRERWWWCPVLLGPHPLDPLVHPWLILVLTMYLRVCRVLLGVLFNVRTLP
ncbi:unnamed protein product [Lactuca saligna]|uniref:Uncharacterized protein n=1 Tax=Lactuca saligna TaxID=75948 RepID=A0AA35VRA8_LACSI|nr:unnamed protein product [Lactuca saligna]